MERQLHDADAASLMRLLDTVQVPVLIFDPTGTLRHASPTLEQALDWSLGDLSGRRTRDMIHPDDHAAMLAAIEGLGQGADLVHLNSRWAVRGGGWRSLDWRALRNRDGGLVHAIAHESGASAPAAAHACDVEAISGVGSWEVDLHSGAWFWSPVSRAIHGLDPGTSLPVAEGLDLYPPEGRVVLKPLMAALRAEGTPFEVELPFITSGGAGRWLRCRGAAEHRDGRVLRIFGTFEDITACRADRARLEDFADIVELASDGIWVIDADGRTHYANARMAAILGHGGASITGRPLVDFTEEPARVLALRTAGTTNADLHLQRADGCEQCLSLSARPRHDAQGQLTSVIVIVADVTEARAQMREVQRLGEVARLTTNPVVITDCLGRIDL